MKRYKRRFIVSAVLLAPVMYIGLSHAYQWRLTHAEYVAPPSGMALIPAGEFVVGTDAPDAGADEGTLSKEFLPAFYIDIHEVTNTQYREFDSTHVFPEGEEDFPVTGKSIEQARTYASAIGKRLPTREEWEKAARGTDDRDYTWGDDYKLGHANLGNQKKLTPVGSFPESVSPYGVHDMIGNAWEWVDDIYYDGGYFKTGTRPIVRDIIKGGAFAYSPDHGRITYNGYEAVGTTCNDISFRCAQDATPIR